MDAADRSSVPLFLPTLMLGLTDELPAIRTDAVQQIEGVAAAYQAMQVRRTNDLFFSKGKEIVSELTKILAFLQGRLRSTSIVAGLWYRILPPGPAVSLVQLSTVSIG